jgi:hypothetical protein
MKRRPFIIGLSAALTGTRLAPLIAWAQGDEACTGTGCMAPYTPTQGWQVADDGSSQNIDFSTAVATGPETDYGDGSGTYQTFTIQGEEWTRRCSSGCASNCDNYGCQKKIKDCGEVQCLKPGTVNQYKPGKMLRRVRCYWFRSNGVGFKIKCDMNSSKCCDYCKIC